MIIKTPMRIKLTVRSLFWSKCSCSHNRSVSGSMSACDARSLQRQLSRASRDIYFSKYLHLVLTVREDKNHTEIKYSNLLVEEKSKTILKKLVMWSFIIMYRLPINFSVLQTTKVFICPRKVFIISALCVLRFNFLWTSQPVVGGKYFWN